MKTTATILLLGLLGVSGAFAGLVGVNADSTVQPIPVKAEKIAVSSLNANQMKAEKFAGTRRMTPPREASDALTADFSVEGSGALAPLFTENFDSGFGGWTVDPTEYVTWAVKRIAQPGEAKSFSSINPDDVSSLFVEGPYQVYRREKSTAWSPSFSIPARATLSFYVGTSRNYDDVCRLELSARVDSDTIVLWNSKDLTGEKSWTWHPVSVDISRFAGRDVEFGLTYTWGSGDEMFKSGGYLGDFAIDDFVISAAKTVESVDLTTGEVLSLTDLSEGTPVEWHWTMPGAVPSESDESNPKIYYTRDGEYDITLTVKDAEGNESSRTRTGFARVTGTEPTARILPPATFRYSSTRKYMVAPLVPVTYSDASAGFPDSWSWSFTGVDPDHTALWSSSDEQPEVAYNFLHEQYVGLEVANSHGSSTDACEVSVEYSGVINNQRPDDVATNFDMEDWGVFPGSNTRKITAYAERFSKPSRPIVINGAYVYFDRNQTTELIEQIANIGVHLYTSKDGKPDKCVESYWWSAFELDVADGGSVVGTAFPFDSCPVVDDEFFIVVDGIPEFNDGCCVSFTMAGWRSEGNTALLLKEGVWMEVPEYFGADKHTSFMIYPSITHSVISPLPTDARRELTVGKEAGSFEYEIFSIMGYKTPLESDVDWLRLESTPNGLTVDTLTIAYDALPEGLTNRTGHIYISDGVDKLELTVNQDSTSGISTVAVKTGLRAESPVVGGTLRLTGVRPGETVEVYSLSGVKMVSIKAASESLSVDASGWPAGLYIVRAASGVCKVAKVKG